MSSILWFLKLAALWKYMSCKIEYSTHHQINGSKRKTENSVNIGETYTTHPNQSPPRNLNGNRPCHYFTLICWADLMAFLKGGLNEGQWVEVYQGWEAEFLAEETGYGFTQYSRGSVLHRPTLLASPEMPTVISSSNFPSLTWISHSIRKIRLLNHHANTFSKICWTNAAVLCSSKHSMLHIHTHRQWLLDVRTQKQTSVRVVHLVLKYILISDLSGQPNQPFYYRTYPYSEVYNAKALILPKTAWF